MAHTGLTFNYQGHLSIGHFWHIKGFQRHKNDPGIINVHVNDRGWYHEGIVFPVINLCHRLHMT